MYTFRVLITILTLLLMMVVGCARVKFSSEKSNSSSSSSSSSSDVSMVEVEASEQTPSYFQRYLNGQTYREHVIAWIFSDVSEFRGHIYDIKLEVKNIDVMDAETFDKILLLQYELNQIIQTFNNKGVWTRLWDVFYTRMEKITSTQYGNISMSPESLRETGISARVLTHAEDGFWTSVSRNGFQVEEVDLMKFRNQ